jgi:AraC-like DNA-binding protein
MRLKFESFSEVNKEIDYHLRCDVGLKWTLSPSDRFCLVFPRGVSRLRLTASEWFPPRSCASPLILTSTSFAFCSYETSLFLETLTIFGHVAILLPSSDRWQEHEIENHLSEHSRKSIREKGIVKLRLTRWLDELIDRYDFERRINSRSPSQCSFFVEKQILNEVIRILCPNEVPSTGELIGTERNSELARALNWIDEQIFQENDVESLAIKMNKSVSQVNKIFRSELNCTPMFYVAELR